jgi:para-aminobenzoate synthetase component I
MLRGNLFSEPDRNLLRRHLSELRDKTAPPPGKQPGAGLYGRVGYEGDFIFGVYPSVEVVHADLGIGFQPVGGDFLPVRVLPSTMDQNVYGDAVAAALDYIAAGDVYQVNLARSFVAELPDSVDENWWARSFYERLRAISPAPYAGFMRMGGQLVLSSSPECFLQIQDRDIITRPIKGTRPRLESLGQDLQMQEALLHSGKERAELLMITDLQRNDLGRSCEFGSISVPEMARVETFSHVHHLVATIGGKLRADIDHVEALWAAFPGGSITGAPKSGRAKSSRNWKVVHAVCIPEVWGGSGPTACPASTSPSAPPWWRSGNYSFIPGPALWPTPNLRQKHVRPRTKREACLMRRGRFGPKTCEGAKAFFRESRD